MPVPNEDKHRPIVPRLPQTNGRQCRSAHLSPGLSSNASAKAAPRGGCARTASEKRVSRIAGRTVFSLFLFVGSENVITCCVRP
jgi:hypothetical protein